MLFSLGKGHTFLVRIQNQWMRQYRRFSAPAAGFLPTVTLLYPSRRPLVKKKPCFFVPNLAF